MQHSSYFMFPCVCAYDHECRTPFEALYGIKCRTPLNWIEPGERRYFGIDFVNEAKEQVHVIQ